MDCPTCTEEYDYSIKVPLSCNCGFTLCKSCVYERVTEEDFKCPDCLLLQKPGALSINRGLDQINQEILLHQETLRYSDSVKKKRKLRSSLITRDITSSAEYELLNQSFILVDEQGILAKPDALTNESQTLFHYVLTEKLNNAKSPVEVHCSRSFIVPLYFSFVAPWIFLAYFGYDGNSNAYTAEILKLIGFWLLNFSFLSIFIILASKDLRFFKKSHLTKPKFLVVLLLIACESVWLVLAWRFILNDHTDGKEFSQGKLAIEAMTTVVSCFNTLFIILSGFVIITGHPLIKSVQVLAPDKKYEKKALSYKIFLIFVLYLIPDINYINENYSAPSSPNGMSSEFFIIYFYAHIFSIILMAVSKTEMKSLVISSILVVIFHAFCNLLSIFVIETQSSNKIYNSFIDFLFILVYIGSLHRVMKKNN